VSRKSTAIADHDDDFGVPISGSKTGLSELSRIALLTGIFSVVGLLCSAYRAPDRMFLRFVAMDSGAELAIQDMVGRGFSPGVDFGYPYGLLPLLLGRAWSGITGSVESVALLVFPYVVFLSWGLARFAAYRRIGLAGLALISLAMLDLTYVTGLTSTHVLEPALLIYALAEQARGRRGSALAWLTACCFVKPSLAFVQGFVVLLAAVIANRGAPRPTARVLVPPLITGLVLLGVLGSAFGLESLVRTISPATGAEIYRVNDFGFFHGQGRAFWVLPDASLRDYFRYEVGFWMLGTAFLGWGGISGALRLARGEERGGRSRDDEMVVTCAVVHLSFVTLLFGHRVTWVYSLTMLILGLATMAGRGPRARLVVLVLAGLLLVNDRSKFVAARQIREELIPSKSTLGLWTSPRELEEWTRARQLTEGHRPVLLAMSEGGAVLFPGFSPPMVAYLYPGCPTPGEVRRKAEQLAEASAIISFYPPDWDGFDQWPRLKAAIDDCELVFEGQLLRVYRREFPEAVESEGSPPDFP
jgi:hypothetical protein